MTDSDQEGVYSRARLGGRLVPGARPAVLVVDFSRGFTDPTSPLGADLAAEVRATLELLDCARSRGVPIIFTTVCFEPDGSNLGVWRWKSPAMAELVPGSPGVEIDPHLGVLPGEPVLVKQGASAFFGTDLHARLAALGADTLVICGATTSGCVRATAVDCLQYGYLGLVPRECVGDRSRAPHDAALFDMQAKYVDVISLSDAIAYLER